MARAISGCPYAVVTLHEITDRSGTGRNGARVHHERRANAHAAPTAVGHNHGRTRTATNAETVNTHRDYMQCLAVKRASDQRRVLLLLLQPDIKEAHCP